MRATLRLSSPAWLAAPSGTSSTDSAGMPARAPASRTTSAARSSGRTPARAPPYRPWGVRTPPTRNASGIVLPGEVAPRLQREEATGDEVGVGQRGGRGRIGRRAVQVTERG